MALIDTYRKNVVKKRDEIAKLASDKAKCYSHRFLSESYRACQSMNRRL